MQGGPPGEVGIDGWAGGSLDRLVTADDERGFPGVVTGEAHSPCLPARFIGNDDAERENIREGARIGDGDAAAIEIEGRNFCGIEEHDGEGAGGAGIDVTAGADDHPVGAGGGLVVDLTGASVRGGVLAGAAANKSVSAGSGRDREAAVIGPDEAEGKV